MQVHVVKGASKAEAERFYEASEQPDASLRLRRHRPELLRVQQSGERLPHLRRSRRGQADASGAARFPIRSAASAAAASCKEAFQVQPGHVGRADDVQPRRRRSASRSTRRGRSCPKRRARRFSTASSTKVTVTTPPDAKVKRDDREGKEVGFGGIARRIERQYRRYRQRGEANSGMEAWLDKVMVEHTCPDCNGARLRATRLLFTIAGKTIYDIGQLNFDELHAFLGGIKPAGPRRRCRPAGAEGDSRPPRAAARHRPRLPEFQSPLRHALRRRVAAHPASRRRSARASWACSTCSTSRASACTRRTTSR